MPFKTKPLTDAELKVHEETRDLTKELLQSIHEMKAGRVEIIPIPTKEATNRQAIFLNYNKTASQAIEFKPSEAISKEISDQDLQEKVLSRLADKGNAVEVDIDDL